MNYFMTCMRKYVDFSGRARRAEYWWFTLISHLLSLIPYLILMIAAIGAAAQADDSDGSTPGAGSWLFGLAGFMVLILLLLYLVFLLPSLAVHVRRLHDTGKSGLWILLNLVPLVGPVVLLVFNVLDSTPGPNQWGPNPKGIGNGPGPYAETGGYGQVGGYYPVNGHGQAIGHQQGTYGQPGPYAQW